MPDPVDEIAARWALRDPLDTAAQAELDGWLAQNPRHAGALLRARAALTIVDRALSLEPRSSPMPPLAPTRRWLLAGVGGAMAAAIVGLVGWPRLMGEHVQTARG